MTQKDSYKVIGVMSGTSLDGLDLILCLFTRRGDSWEFRILRGETIDYSDELKQELGHAQKLSAYDFVELHRRYGKFIGDEVAKFALYEKDIDFVASHGHTVFHEPENQVTFQIGCGAQIAAQSGLKVVSDFRTLDIALGGQGAPLVPIGDRVLFGQYDACVNLGGFANLSFMLGEERIAFDICPVNIVLNEIVFKEFGMIFDTGGKLGAEGVVHNDLLSQLNDIEFYKLSSPKSLAREWVEETFMPVLNSYEKLDKKDILATCYHHFAFQIAQVLDENKLSSSLFTGGGTFNNYMMELIKGYTKSQVVIPGKEVIDFKEALIFAYLGVLRVEEQINCLSSVTGAKYDNSGGSIFLP